MSTSLLKPFIKVAKRVDRMGDLIKSLKSLEKRDVLIGLPEDANQRTDGSDLTNAQIAFIQAHGSPIQHIPPRPFLEPSIWANRNQIAAQQGRVIRSALTGNVSQAGAELEKVGLIGQNVAKGWFLDPRNGWPPNAPYTIAKKGSDQPLIDTGQLRNAITYVMRQK